MHVDRKLTYSLKASKDQLLALFEILISWLENLYRYPTLDILTGYVSVQLDVNLMWLISLIVSPMISWKERSKNRLKVWWQTAMLKSLVCQYNSSKMAVTGIFAIAFSTCIVYGLDPRDMTFDIPRMCPHLSQCLKDGIITPFPTY